jgi:hypothetical protein
MSRHRGPRALRPRGHLTGRRGTRQRRVRRGVPRRRSVDRETRRRRRAAGGLSGERGQASVELVALLPLALLVGLAILTLLAARAAEGQAGAAAQAGAMALLQDADPREAARAAVPRAARERTTIRVAGRQVTVTIQPATKVAFLAGAVTASASADAGPEPR